jgi:hypothetical protein
MDTLDEAIAKEGSLPSGLFWLHRGQGAPLPRMQKLLARAAEAGEAALVRIENFDEAMRDLLRLVNGIDTRVLDSFATERRRWTGAPVPAGSGGWPVVRLNALPVVQAPSVCRRVICQIGGYAELRKAIQKAGGEVLAARTRAGVLVFGSDANVRAAFTQHDITDFGLHTIETKRLRHDTAERGVLRDALTKAIA